MTRRRSTISSLAKVAALFILVLTVFHPVVGYEFTTFDDNTVITDNPNLGSGLSVEGTKWAFTTIYASNWVPLTWLSHMLDVQLFGLDPSGHHFVNLIFHALNSALLFLLLQAMTGVPWASFLCAALFAVHPLHVESVAWVTERRDVLSTFFWLLALRGYRYYVLAPSRLRYLLALVPYTLGLMSKPMVVTLPFVLLLLDYWPLGRFEKVAAAGGRASPLSRKSLGTLYRLVIEKIPFFLLSGILAVVTYSAQARSGAAVSFERYSLPIRLANAAVSYVTYIKKMAWPTDLAVYYPHAGNGIALWKVAGACLLLTGITVFVVKAAGRRPYLVVGWLWYLGTLVPVIGIVQVGAQAMADRFTYIPLIGLYIMTGYSTYDFAKRSRFRTFILPAAAFVLLALVFASRKQVSHWQDSRSLYEHTLRVTSRNWKIHFNLGLYFEQMGMYPESVSEYYKVYTIKPSYPFDFNRMGLIMAASERHSEAVQMFETGLRSTPENGQLHFNMGTALANLGRNAEALDHFRSAVRLQPDNPEMHNNLGVILIREGLKEEASSHFLEALRIDPEYRTARENLERARGKD